MTVVEEFQTHLKNARIEIENARGVLARARRDGEDINHAHSAIIDVRLMEADFDLYCGFIAIDKNMVAYNVYEGPGNAEDDLSDMVFKVEGSQGQYVVPQTVNPLGINLGEVEPDSVVEAEEPDDSARV